MTRFRGQRGARPWRLQHMSSDAALSGISLPCFDTERVRRTAAANNDHTTTTTPTLPLPFALTLLRSIVSRKRHVEFTSTSSSSQVTMLPRLTKGCFSFVPLDVGIDMDR